MDKETLSNYGWVVIVIIVLVIMIALATPFGGYISEAAMNATKSLGNKQSTVFQSIGIESKEVLAKDKELEELFGDKITKYKDTLVPGQKPTEGNRYFIYSSKDMPTDFSALPQVTGVTYKGTPKDYSWFKTGDNVEIYKDGEKVANATIIVLGDVGYPNNVDGMIDAMDHSATDMAIGSIKRNTYTLKNAADLIAMDINRNGTVDTEDYNAIGNASIGSSDKYQALYNLAFPV